MLVFILIVILIGLIPASIANSKGRNFILWWIYGSLLFIVALIHAIYLKPYIEDADDDLLNEGMRQCPFCAENIKDEAIKCKHCGEMLPEKIEECDADEDTEDEQQEQTSVLTDIFNNFSFVGRVVFSIVVASLIVIVLRSELFSENKSASIVTESVKHALKEEGAQYSDYYNLIRKRIFQYAYDGYDKMEEGDVFVSFVLNSLGEIEEVSATEKPVENKYLRKIAVEAVRKSAPFPAFPSSVHASKLQFNIQLSYNVRKDE